MIEVVSIATLWVVVSLHTLKEGVEGLIRYVAVCAGEVLS